MSKVEDHIAIRELAAATTVLSTMVTLKLGLSALPKMVALKWVARNWLLATLTCSPSLKK